MHERSPDGGIVVTGGHTHAGTPARTTSQTATHAMWLGVLGVCLGFLLMFAVLTPAAIVYGVRALRELRIDPELSGRPRAWAGIGLGLLAPLLWVGLFVGLLDSGAI